MAETANYSLYVSSDDQTKFKTWREEVAGETDSNMTKIDAALKAHDDALAGKQNKLTGTLGQVVGFNAQGNAVPQAAPDTGVTSFNGRSGAVTPQDGDYTAEQVGARPDTWTPTVDDIGALASDGTATKTEKLSESRTIQFNLGSTSAQSFDGTANVTPGVTGTLGVANGGTGVTSLDELRVALGIDKIAIQALGLSSVLNENTWDQIKSASDFGIGANIWSVGDRKAVQVNGTVGTLSINQTLYVYILGFDHNSEKEGKGIQFGTFKTALTGGTDVCLVDVGYLGSTTNGTKTFNMNHWGNYNYGGWKACDMRYDILGSTNIAPQNYGQARTSGNVGYDAPTNTATNPVSNTLMSALPSDLRAVMKPITKYTDNVAGGTGNTAGNVSPSVDYLPLLCEKEIFGIRSSANSYEQDSQEQYDYYKAGNSRVKYKHNSTGSSAHWWERSPYFSYSNVFCDVSARSGASNGNAAWSYGLTPAFMV